MIRDLLGWGMPILVAGQSYTETSSGKRRGQDWETSGERFLGLMVSYGIDDIAGDKGT